MLTQTSTYVKSYDDETKWMYFLNEDGELLKKYNKIWNKIRKSIKKGLIVSQSTIKKVQN